VDGEGTSGEERILPFYLRVIFGWGREKEFEIPVGGFDTAGVYGRSG
jgi:hypothetical protein